MDLEIIERPSLINADGTPILSSNDIYAPRVFVNTREFRRAALTFMRHGCYTKARKGTKEYRDYWNREANYCMKGMRVGDLWISGKHYFYLNYCRIKKVPCRDYLEIHPHASKNVKVLTFPDFWEVDLRWWYTKELASQNAENAIEQGHIVCLKTRRGGFSFKEAVEGVWNYTFLRDTVSMYYAFSEVYLTKEGIFNKVASMLNFLNQHTAWSQIRQRGVGHDSTYHLCGKYKTNINGRLVEKGRANHLMAQVLDDPEKARGGDMIKLTFEEFGSFKNGILAWETAMPQVKQGATIVGFMTAFGTGSNSENDLYTEAMEELFYNPIAYDCIAFDNIWDEGMEGTECGFFVPATEVRDEFRDDEGNLDREKALQAVLKDREKKEGRKGAASNIIENPLCPAEALTRIQSTLFDVEYAKKAKRRLETDGRLNSLIHCRMIGTFKEPKYVLVSKEQAYNKYPVKSADVKDGCVVLVEEPVKIDGKVPDQLYFITHDPYSKDDAPDSDSIGSMFLVKRANTIDNTPYDKIIGWYHGRPKTREIYNRQMFLLAAYFNAMIQFEIEGGGQSVVEFAKRRDVLLTHLLHVEPEMLHNKEIAGNQKNRSYGVKVAGGNKTTSSRAKVFNGYLADMLFNTVYLNEEGEPVLYIDLVEDIGLLEEVIKYRDDKNVDRISAARLIPMMVRELEAVEIQARSSNPNSLFNRSLYGSRSQLDTFGTMVSSNSSYSNTLKSY